MTERIDPGHLWQAGLLLAWLGAFLLGTGILLRVYVYHHVAQLPLNAYTVTQLHATGVTYFDPAAARTRTGLSVTATSTLRGDAGAARGDTAVYDTFLAVQATDGTPIEYLQTRTALDRHTGLLVNCCGARIGGDSNVRGWGLGFKFPFFAGKASYQVFDSDARRPVPATYAGQTSIDGMPVYRYVQVLATSQIGQRRVPQSIMGLPPRPLEVTVRSLEAKTVTFWVDPVTGVPIKVEENTRQSLQTRNGRHTRLVFAADFKQSPADVAAAVRRYQGQSRELAVLHGALPVGGVLAGVVLIVIGTLLVYAGNRHRGDAAMPEPPDRALAAPAPGASVGDHSQNG